MGQRVQAYLAELIGTFILVFWGTMAVTIFLVKIPVLPAGAGLIAIAFSFGIAVMIAIYSVGHISGAHINPMVTIFLAAIKRFPGKDVIPYIIMQLIGASIAGGLHRLILPEGIAVLWGATLLGAGVGIGTALLVEIVLTFLLAWIIMGAAVDERTPAGWAGIAIGSVIAINTLIGGPLTGASMNPARSFGPALVVMHWTNHWIYWIGPIIGGLLAGFIYEYAFKPARK